MATQPIDRPVTPLRQRMLEDTAMRRMGARTQHDYVRHHVRACAGFLGRSPDTATAEDVLRFQRYRTPAASDILYKKSAIQRR